VIVVFLGPPGAGKGTQCKLLVDKYGLRHLSSGDILRRERRENTELGRNAQTYMDAGQLVPDDLIIAMMMKAIENTAGSTGFILDGFPRTLEQARQLDASLAKAGQKVDAVLNLEVDDAKLELRVTGRRSCPKCGAAYHIAFNAPRRKDVCDHDGEKLVQRPDDTADVVRNRIENYHKLTAPLVEYYQTKKNVHSIDGNGDIGKVTEALYAVMDRLIV
jgi:adenylate kinase